MAQTSVEWLVEKIKDEEIIIYHGLFDRWVEQAKSIENKQKETSFFCLKKVLEDYGDSEYLQIPWIELDKLFEEAINK